MKINRNKIIKFLNQTIDMIGDFVTLNKFVSVTKDVYGEGEAVYETYKIKGICWFGINEEIAKMWGVEITADFNFVTSVERMQELGLPITYTGYENSTLTYKGVTYQIVRASPVGFILGEPVGFVFNCSVAHT